MYQLKPRGTQTVLFTANEPLHKRVPTRDEEGRLLSDFMMLIPGLREWPKGRFNDRVAGIQAVLGGFNEVVFADLNVPLNLLWVSVKAEPGIISAVAASIQYRVPEARVISSH
jgi:hypothetical protein